MSERKEIPVVFSPGNEAYLGRPLLFHFDKLITATLEQNAVSAPTSHGESLTDHQQMACQVIAQAISITLSIRELIRQGYLFGAHVLLRALVERSAILLCLNLHPEEIALWKRGWHMNDGAPSLSKMIDAIEAKRRLAEALGGTANNREENDRKHEQPAAWQARLRGLEHNFGGRLRTGSRSLENSEPPGTLRRSLRERNSMACCSSRNDARLFPDCT